MDDLLSAVKTVNNREESQISKSLIRDSETGQQIPSHLDADSAESILEILRSKPGRAQVIQVLHLLDPARAPEKGFNITVPNSSAAQILHVLISTTIPDHWNSLGGDHDAEPSAQSEMDTKPKAALLRCLSSVAGIGALIVHLRSLLAAQDSSTKQVKDDSGNLLIIRDLLCVLSSLLKPQGLLLHVYKATLRLIDSSTHRELIWKELTALLAAGKVLSTAAEALAAIKDLSVSRSVLWIGEGSNYASWLGKRVCQMASKLQPSETEAWKSLAFFTGRALKLGYPGIFPYSEDN
jgi:telomere length regulation protein